MPQKLTNEEVSKHYYKILGKRASVAMAEKAKNGDLPGCAPIGYLNARRDGEVYVEVNPETAPLVQEAFAIAAEGSFSVRKMLTILTTKGLVSRNRKSLGASSLHAMLTNPFYIGKLRYGSEVLEGRHEPLVNQNIFDRVQNNLANRRKK